MDRTFERFVQLFGEEAYDKLSNAKVAVFGLGGVGGWCTEALARSGVGEFALFDGDSIDITNINRQIVALHSDIGENKAEMMKKRILDINPDAIVKAYPIFYTCENSGLYPFDKYDYIVDAIDSVKDKIEIIKNAKNANVRILSAMGAGKKTDPSKYEVADIYSTSVCPLAKTMRKLLKDEGITELKVVYSKEPPRTSGQTISSVVFAVCGAGIMMAREVVFDLAGIKI